MKSILLSKNIWIAIVLWVGFWPVAVSMPRPYLFDLVNALVIGGCVAVFVRYAPSVYNSIFSNKLNGAHYLVIGIAGFAAAQAARYMWNWVWRYLDKPPYMQDHIFVAWLIWVAFTFSLVHLMAWGVVDGNMPKKNWRWLSFVIVFSVSLALGVIWYLEP